MCKEIHLLWRRNEFEAVWERFGEQNKAVVVGVLVRMLAGFSDLGV